MNMKVTAIVLASVLASPVMMAKISMAASGKGKGGAVTAAFSGGGTKTELEAEMRDRARGAKGEVEFEQKIRSGITKSKLKAEAEIVVPAGTDPMTLTPTVDVDVNGLLCEITNPPILRSKTKNGVTTQKFHFEGSLKQQGVDPLTDPITDNGLDCGGITTFPTFAVGNPVTVTIGGVDADVVLNGTLQLDD